MTRDKQFEVIRAACIKANPDRGWTFYDHIHSPIIGPLDEPVRLADVLLAIDKAKLKDRVAVYETGEVTNWLNDEKVFWNLRQDDLTEQRDECLAFLAELLGNHGAGW